MEEEKNTEEKKKTLLAKVKDRTRIVLGPLSIALNGEFSSDVLKDKWLSNYENIADGSV